MIRPAVHLAPPAGWLNDPNGLCRHGGVYHAFYQHNPAADVWGPMHWRHATSTDLHHWEDHGIALAPDELGMIFSGSVVVDSDGSAGFGAGALVAVFTYAGEGAQTQGLAGSRDGGYTWTKHPGNPVLVSPTGEKDFRDPKVFWWGPPGSGHWVMVLAVGRRAEIYRSSDLRSWDLSGTFAPELAGGGIWECPDLFALPVDGAGESCWVLTASVGGAGPHGHGGTVGFVGDFDGVRFTPQDPGAPPRLLDHGPDFYAAQSFSNLPEGRTVWMGWLNSWHYALSVPSDGWRGMLSVPRDLDLVTTSRGISVRQRPTPELTALRGRCLLRHDGPLSRTLEFPADGDSPGCDVTIRMERSDGQAAVVLEVGDAAGPAVVLTVTGEEITVGRSSAPGLGRQVADSFAQVYRAPLEPAPGPVEVRAVLDSTSLEVFADGGVTVLSATYFCEGIPALRLRSAGRAPNSLVVQAEAYGV